MPHVITFGVVALQFISVTSGSVGETFVCIVLPVCYRCESAESDAINPDG